jgi:hypothetical protein
MEESARAFAHEWLKLLGELTALAGLSPPQGARVYAYAALAEYELWAALGYDDSILGKMETAPQAPDAGSDVDCAVAVAATYAQMTSGLVPGRDTRHRVDDLLGEQLARRLAAGVPTGVVSRSVGTAGTVSAITKVWADSDGRAEASAQPYVAPTDDAGGAWVPTFPLFGPPTDPLAGSVRPFLLKSVDEVTIAGPPPFSASRYSFLYRQAEEVRQAQRHLTDRQRDLAFFWSDATGPSVGATPGPAGHWLYNACSIERQHELAPPLGAKMRACLAVAMHDAMTSCWHYKYKHNLLRPITYIERHIEPGWAPMLATPKFPEYPSGHSVVSHCAARILSAFVGHGAFTDETQVHLGMPGTRYQSLVDAAKAASLSRLYGGIHYPIGLTNGASLGQGVADLVGRRLGLS